MRDIRALMINKSDSSLTLVSSAGTQSHSMILAILVVQCLCTETTGWNLLHDISRFLKKLPELRGRRGTTRKSATASHYRDRLASEVEGCILHFDAPHCEDSNVFDVKCWTNRGTRKGTTSLDKNILKW